MKMTDRSVTEPVLVPLNRLPPSYFLRVGGRCAALPDKTPLKTLHLRPMAGQSCPAIEGLFAK